MPELRGAPCAQAAAPTPAGGLPGKAPPAGLALTATAGQQALGEQEDERLRLRALLASGALQQAPDQPRFTRITQLLAYLFEASRRHARAVLAFQWHTPPPRPAAVCSCCSSERLLSRERPPVPPAGAAGGGGYLCGR